MVRLTNVAKRRVLLALILSLLIVAAWPVAAANIYIDYTCILKEALEAANKDKEKDDCEAGSGDDVIILTRDDKPRSGELPAVKENLVIEGNNHTINADRNDPAFEVEGAHLTIKNLKIEFDRKRKREAFEVTDGKLTLINVVVENCEEGIEQEDSHITIKGNSDICGLSADEIVEGDGGTTDITLPAPIHVDTCSQIGGGIVVTATFGAGSGVQCQLVDGPGIGVQSVVDAGFITAVNLWAYVEQGVEICFPNIGSITFIDTTTSPRVVSTIDSYRRDNSTCAHVTRPGTVVLAPGQPTSGTPPVASGTTMDQPTTGTGAAPASAGCPIHTTGHLFLRASPSLQGTVLGAVPRGSNLISPSRTTYWYQVTYNGQTGWIGHKYVRANC